VNHRLATLRLAASLAAALPTTLAAQDAAKGQQPATPATQASVEERLRALEARLDQKETEMQALEKKLAAKSEGAAKWYDKLSIRGYGQVRYTTLYNEDNEPNISVPNDRSVNEAETLLLRRGRVILSGDVTDHLFVYAQSDFAGSTGVTGSDSAVQMRDFYGDIAVDKDKEHRFRVGQSKVPFGWVNLQSSQNRAAIERPDALNSAFEGERDMGAYYYWAPKHIRDLFRDLVRSGRKGSGDYGVIGVGAFAGQGPNRSDRNGDVHWVARASYPFEFENKQVVELGVQGYTGHYVVGTAAVGGVTPTVEDGGVRDERLASTFVLYPQPFGLEAEWNWGRGPQLADDRTAIDTEYLQGGYVQANYMLKTESGVWFPFARWNFFDGARKFATNAPKDEVSEFDVGIEYSPVPEVEITVMYTHTFWRTDTTDTTLPYYDEARSEDRIGFQVQVNF
jgi:hypothetical protein